MIEFWEQSKKKIKIRHGKLKSNIHDMAHQWTAVISSDVYQTTFLYSASAPLNWCSHDVVPFGFPFYFLERISIISILSPLTWFIPWLSLGFIYGHLINLTPLFISWVTSSWLDWIIESALVSYHMITCSSWDALGYLGGKKIFWMKTYWNHNPCDGFKIYLEATYVYRYSVIFNSLPKYFILNPTHSKKKKSEEYLQNIFPM